MTTLLVDGNNLLARADFAARTGVEMSVNGVNTAALVIFINMLSRYVRQVEPTRMAVFWDAGHDFRDRLYPEYKSNRNKHDGNEPEVGPFAQAKEFLTWAGIPHKSHKGYEADDLIAATARGSVGKVVILSGDKDLLQLVADENPYEFRSVTQIRPPDDTEWDEERVHEKFGVDPKDLPYYLALVGDTSDGVPGVRGIGPKKACALLEKAAWTWEAVLDLLGPEKAEQARLMLSLVDLRGYEYDRVFMLSNIGAPAFAPTLPDGGLAWTALESFCLRFQLNSVFDRLQSGTLWTGVEGVKPRTEGLFDNLDTPGQMLDPLQGPA